MNVDYSLSQTDYVALSTEVECLFRDRRVGEVLHGFVRSRLAEIPDSKPDGVCVMVLRKEWDRKE